MVARGVWSKAVMSGAILLRPSPWHRPSVSFPHAVVVLVQVER